MKKEDFTGRRFGRLVVLQELESVNYRRRMLVKCDCGNEKDVRLSHLTGGLIVSCRCVQKERIIQLSVTHNLHNHPLYSLWNGIKMRCYNPNRKSFKNYGGRGIKMYDLWKRDFQSFYDWSIKNGWKKGLQIDRIDNNGWYSPDNCRFVTAKINSRNRRNNVILEMNGHKKTMAEWSEQYGVDLKILWQRINSGMPLSEALVYKKSVISDQDVVDIFKSTEPAHKLSAKYGISLSSISAIKTKRNYSRITNNITK